jgi:very-short-patch-repair endonuclease
MTPVELARDKALRLPDLEARAAAELAATQLGVTMSQRDGVVARAELMAAGLTRPDIDRLLRRRSLARVHRRVYVDHTGPLTYDQRLWAAVLAVAPAVVCGRTVLDADPKAKVIHVAVDASRPVASPDGVRVHRVRGLDAVAQWRAAPPRMRREDAVLMLVDGAETELDVVRLLTDAARDRAIGVARLRQAEQRRRRLRRRAFVTAVLDDVAGGAESVLEHAYLARVERAHGLPRPSRQVRRRAPGGNEYRDVEYEEHGLVVELDGRLHDSFDAKGRDAQRDLADQVDRRDVVRLRWRQVVGAPGATAASLAILLQQRGWSGRPTPCGPSCRVGRDEIV